MTDLLPDKAQLKYEAAAGLKLSANSILEIPSNGNFDYQ